MIYTHKKTLSKNNFKYLELTTRQINFIIQIANVKGDKYVRIEKTKNHTKDQKNNY